MSTASALKVINLGIELLTVYTTAQPILQKASDKIAAAIKEGRTINDAEIKELLSDDQAALDEFEKTIAMKKAAEQG